MENQFPSAYMPYQQNQSSQSPAGLAPYPGLPAAQSQQNSQQSQQSQPPQTTQSGSAQPSQASSQASHHDAPAHPTLPPLNQNGYSHFNSLPYGHAGSGAPTPTTPHTPASSSIGTSHGSAYPHLSPASAMGPPSSFNGLPYSTSQAMMYPSQTSTANSNGSGLPTIRPMPSASGNISASLAQLPSLATTQLGQHNSFMQNEEAPTHVVGSQGRRGILPSAPGRPNATAGGLGGSTKAMSLQKDADGKFPCPHCNKTYLHAKHLKRHMLRRKYSLTTRRESTLTLSRHWRQTILLPSVQRYLLEK